jgi:phenylalanine ammonia-lyase
MDVKLYKLGTQAPAPLFITRDDTVIVRGENLTISEVVRVARYNAKVLLTDDANVRRRAEASHDYILDSAKAGKAIYGVTTGFGGLANTVISPEETA